MNLTATVKNEKQKSPATSGRAFEICYLFESVF